MTEIKKGRKKREQNHGAQDKKGGRGKSEATIEAWPNLW